MKLSKYTFMAFLACLTLFTACNSDESSERNGESTEKDGVQFTFSASSYGDDSEITRSVVRDTASVRDTVSLDNGLEAEISIENESANSHSAITTRATEISNQHYTIYALKNGVRVATLSGTVSGSGASKAFTPDAGTPGRMQLEPGTYTFVCHNDKVTATGNQLSVSSSNAGEALIGTTTKTISGPTDQVHFEMKHQAARVRFELTTYWDIDGITADVLPSASDPVTMTYDLSASNPQYTAGSNTVAYTFQNSVVEQANYTYTSLSDYQYFLPTTKQ